MAARYPSDAVKRLGRDPTLYVIDLTLQKLSDSELAELADCLLTHPHSAWSLYLSGNRLTDQMGVKLAQFLATSSTIQTLSLSINQLGEATYLAVAAALRHNTSLQYLYLSDNLAVDTERIDAAFVDSLRLNPSRRTGSMWQLYSVGNGDLDFKRLKEAVRHPSLQMLLLSLNDCSPPPVSSAESSDRHSAARSCLVASRRRLEMLLGNFLVSSVFRCACRSGANLNRPVESAAARLTELNRPADKRQCRAFEEAAAVLRWK